MKDLCCSGSSLTGLELGNNSALDTLYCADNQIETLDVSNNLELAVLTCAGNLLTRLDLSHNPLLAMLYCYDNRITKLDISTCSALDNLYKNCEHQPDGDTIVIDDEEGAYMCYDSDTVIITAVDMYSLYNPNSGEHHYTTSRSERDNFISIGWYGIAPGRRTV